MEKGKPNPYSKKKIKQTNGYTIYITLPVNKSLARHVYKK
jgi:hypothetical protein